MRTRFIDMDTGELAPLFHPRADRWTDHFQWGEDGRTIVGRTPSGRATVGALDMNAALRVEARSFWRELGMLP